MTLTNKYRPQNFSDVIGQTKTIEALTTAVNSPELTHRVYILAGYHGCGKTTIARIIAKKIANSEFDIIEIDAARNNGVDFARDLSEQVGFCSFGGGYKIYIIDEAHEMTKQAYNALLKTLEDENSKTLFFFCTTEPRKIISTIKSRSQNFTINPIPENLILNHIKNIRDWENLAHVSNEILETISQNVDGVMRDAITDLAQIALLKEPTIDDYYGFKGKPPQSQLLEIMSGLKDGNLIRIKVAIKEAYKSGTDAVALMQEISNFISNALTGSWAGRADPKAFKVMTCDSKTFKVAIRWGKSFDKNQLMELQVLFMRASIGFDAVKSPKLYLETLIVEALLKLQQPTLPIQAATSSTPSQVKHEPSINWEPINNHPELAKLFQLATNKEYRGDNLILTLPTSLKQHEAMAYQRFNTAIAQLGIDAKFSVNFG